MSDKSDDLIISISTDLATVKRSLKQLETDVGSSTKNIGKQFDGLGKTIDTSITRSTSRSEAAISRLGKISEDASAKIAKILAVGASLKGAQSLVDTFTKVQNSLKVAGLEGDNLKTVYDALFASAQKNGAPIDALATLYGRAASAANELGASQSDLIKFAEGVSLAVRASGQSASESSGALLQLSQAIGGGVIQAQEYNSLLDAGRPILQAVAAGMKEAGGSVAKLTELVKAGEVPSKAFFYAFLAGTSILDKAVASSEQTISTRFQRLQNALIDFAGRLNDTATNSKEAASATTLLGNAIDSVSTEIEKFNVNKFAEQLDYIIQKLTDAKTAGMNFADWVGSKTGLGKIGDSLPKGGVDVFGGTPLAGSLVISGTHNTPEQIALENTQKRLGLEKKIKELRDDPASTGSPIIQREIKLAQAELAALPKDSFKQPSFPHTPTPRFVGPADPVKPISIKDPEYAAVDPKKVQAAKDAYDALMKSADDRIGQMKQEIDLTGKVGIEQDTARFSLDLLQRSEDKGRSLDADQKKALQDKVDLYKQYSEVLAKVKLSSDLTDKARMRMLSPQDQEITTTLRQYGLSDDLNSPQAAQIKKSLQVDAADDAVKGFLTSFRDATVSNGGNVGKAFAEAVKTSFLDAMTKAGDAAIQRLTNSLVNALFGGSGTSGAGAAGGAAVGAVGKLFGGGAGTAPVIPVTRAPLGDISSYAGAIKSIESGGNYGALGPVTKNGDRAYGAYQVMGANIPSWSKEATGKSMTASEFLTDKGAQDAVFNNKFGSYANKYGSSGAAQAWFGGPGSVGKGGMGTDILGTSGTEYVDKFNKSLGGATKSVGSFGDGLGKLSTSFFPSAPTAPSGGGGLGWLGSIFGGAFKPNGAQASAAASGSIVGLFADGGHITGPGSGTSDSIPAWLSNGEFVVKADATKKNRKLLEAINGGKVARFATGGLVSSRLVQAPTGPSLETPAARGTNGGQPGILQVQIHGASGDDHVRTLVKQGVSEGLGSYNDNQVRGGFGSNQNRWTARRS